jgi:hypothetical protein
MRLHTLLDRLLMCSLTVLVCVWLVLTAGPWAAIGLWAAAIGAICGTVALLMHLQEPGRRSVINRMAGLILPWGYAIGRGKLLPIVIESWFRWVLVGAAVVLLTAHGNPESGLDPSRLRSSRSAIVTLLLFLSWVIDGAVVLRLVTIAATRARPRRLPASILGPIAGIGAMIAASVSLTVFGHNPGLTALALLIAAGPLVVVGGGLGLMFLVMVTFGRHTRWN